MEDEPQVKLRFGLSLFHCRACLRPLRPPTAKCSAGHVVCDACRGSHAPECAGAAAFVPSLDVDVYVRGARLACPNAEFGCESCCVYYQARDHERACQWAPCYCPEPGCNASDSPARLAAHFAATHAWPVTDVSYAKVHRIALPRGSALHLLVSREDSQVFVVSSSALGAGAGAAAAAAAAAALACVRANGDAVAGAPRFRCTLWVQDARGGGNVARVTFEVPSSDLSRGFVAAEQGMFLAVPPELLRDAPGEAPDLMVRIDKAASAAANSPITPPA
ncbi:putative E3 ubiquitin-protein ligase SINA-like 6 [Panicum virgatum]|uniref:putative E3 ubiquitin-protein ligase SINA-like 6 n=1 Tax=Panicum virgatum TaxID=38727 RepID=UPI0019D52DF5|nr:putative E3 ubiquitin-protein ligase SINA-like 6 [Panicum virgatum]